MHLHAGGGHGPKKSVSGRKTSHMVIQNLHIETFVGLVDEDVGDFLSEAVIEKDIVLQID